MRSELFRTFPLHLVFASVNDNIFKEMTKELTLRNRYLGYCYANS